MQDDVEMYRLRRQHSNNDDQLQPHTRRYISASDLRQSSTGNSSRSSTSGRENTSGSILKKRADGNVRCETISSCSSLTAVSPVLVNVRQIFVCYFFPRDATQSLVVKMRSLCKLINRHVHNTSIEQQRFCIKSRQTAEMLFVCRRESLIENTYCYMFIYFLATAFSSHNVFPKYSFK